ncbi:hypothetical protein COBT_000548 [Conglomerata obtusa]
MLASFHLLFVSMQDSNLNTHFIDLKKHYKTLASDEIAAKSIDSNFHPAILYKNGNMFVSEKIPNLVEAFSAFENRNPRLFFTYTMIEIYIECIQNASFERIWSYFEKSFTLYTKYKTSKDFVINFADKVTNFTFFNDFTGLLNQFATKSEKNGIYTIFLAENLLQIEEEQKWFKKILKIYLYVLFYKKLDRIFLLGTCKNNVHNFKESKNQFMNNLSAYTNLNHYIYDLDIEVKTNYINYNVVNHMAKNDYFLFTKGYTEDNEVDIFFSWYGLRYKFSVCKFTYQEFSKMGFLFDKKYKAPYCVLNFKELSSDILIRIFVVKRINNFLDLIENSYETKEILYSISSYTFFKQEDNFINELLIAYEFSFQNKNNEQLAKIIQENFFIEQQLQKQRIDLYFEKLTFFSINENCLHFRNCFLEKSIMVDRNLLEIFYADVKINKITINSTEVQKRIFSFFDLIKKSGCCLKLLILDFNNCGTYNSLENYFYPMFDTKEVTILPYDENSNSFNIKTNKQSLVHLFNQHFILIFDSNKEKEYYISFMFNTRWIQYFYTYMIKSTIKNEQLLAYDFNKKNESSCLLYSYMILFGIDKKDYPQDNDHDCLFDIFLNQIELNIFLAMCFSKVYRQLYIDHFFLILYLYVYDEDKHIKRLFPNGHPLFVDLIFDEYLKLNFLENQIAALFVKCASKLFFENYEQECNVKRKKEIITKYFDTIEESFLQQVFEYRVPNTDRICTNKITEVIFGCTVVVKKSEYCTENDRTSFFLDELTTI